MQAYLPVVESFGFTGTLRAATAGQAFPQWCTNLPLSLSLPLCLHTLWNGDRVRSVFVGVNVSGRGLFLDWGHL